MWHTHIYICISVLARSMLEQGRKWSKEEFGNNSFLAPSNGARKKITHNLSLRQEWNKEEIIVLFLPCANSYLTPFLPCANWNKEGVVFLAPIGTRKTFCSLRWFLLNNNSFELFWMERGRKLFPISSLRHLNNSSELFWRKNEEGWNEEALIWLVESFLAPSASTSWVLNPKSINRGFVFHFEHTTTTTHITHFVKGTHYTHTRA